MKQKQSSSKTSAIKNSQQNIWIQTAQQPLPFNQCDDYSLSNLQNQLQCSKNSQIQNKGFSTQKKKMEISDINRKQHLYNQTKASQNYNTSNNVFSFNQSQPFEQNILNNKWNIPQKQSDNQKINQERINNYCMNYQQDNLSHGEDQNSYIPSDISSNLFESIKSFSFINGSSNLNQQSPINNDINCQQLNQWGFQFQNQKCSNQSLNQGFSQSSLQDQLDSTELIIQNMRADLLQIDPQYQQIKPNSNVEVSPIQEDDSSDQNSQLSNGEKQMEQELVLDQTNENEYLYLQSQPITPSYQKPIEIYDISKRQSFVEINNQLQQPFDKEQNQIQYIQQQMSDSNKTVKQQNNYGFQKDINSNKFEYQSTIKKNKEVPIAQDDIFNIEHSIQYQNQYYQKQNILKNYNKQQIIFENTEDENRQNIQSKQIISDLQNFKKNQKKLPYNSVDILNSIQKKRSISLQNSKLKQYKKQSISPQLQKYNVKVNFYTQPSKINIDDSINIHCQQSNTKNQTKKLNTQQKSPIKSNKKNLQKKNHQQSCFEICSYQKNPQSQLSMQQILKKYTVKEIQQTQQDSTEIIKLLEQDLESFKVKQIKQTNYQNELDQHVGLLLQNHKSISNEILLTDSKVIKLQIKNKQLKEKWKLFGIDSQQVNEQKLYIQQLKTQEQNNHQVIKELNNCNSSMKNQLEYVLQQIQMEKQNKCQKQIQNQNKQTKIQDYQQIYPNNTANLVDSINNQLNSSDTGYFYESMSEKNQQQNDLNMQNNQTPKLDDSFTNVIGNSFEQSDYMISNLIQKYGSSPKKSLTPNSSNFSQNTQTSKQTDQII